MSKTRQLRLRSLSARFSPGHRVDWHSHAWSQLIYATEGVLTVESRTACWVIPQDRGIWVPSGEEHALTMHGRVFLQTVYLEPHQARRTDRTCTALEISGLMHELIRHVCSAGIVRGQTREDRTLIRFFLDQLEQLSPFPLVIHMPQEERARKVARRIIDAPGSPDGLDRICREAGASLRTMQRLFVNDLGLPLSRWRNQVRMVTAVQLLARGGSVTQVAGELGFESLSAFISSFRRYFGESPGKFRSKPPQGPQA